MIPIARPLLGSQEHVAAFERRFAEVCHVSEAVAVSSGTAALHLALLAHGIGPGDEVITTAFSFAATANVILLVSATPVFVDIEPATYTLDPSLVEAALTPSTRAIIPVHLYGHPCDMKRLVAIAATHQVAIIEDACQARAASINEKSVGSFGTGCFSFYATKNITTGEGGMVTTHDPEIAERVRLLRSHGQKERYYHTTLGYNQGMTEIQAALGLVQIKKLEQFTEQRIVNAVFLTKQLRGFVQTPVTHPGYRHVYHQYTIQVPGDRDQWVMQLRERSIDTAVHQPMAIHQQPLNRDQIDTFRYISASERTKAEHTRGEIRLPVTEIPQKQVLSHTVGRFRNKSSSCLSRR